MKTIRILHMIETSGPGGAENVLINLCTHFNQNEFKSIVVLRKRGWLYDELRSRGVKAHIIIEKGLFDVKFLTNLCFFIKKNNIQRIHAHEFLMSCYATMAGLICSIPVITTFHGKYYYWEKLRRRIAMRLISRLSLMVSVSNELRSFLSQRVGIYSERITTIYNGINIDWYRNKGSQPNLREILNIRKNDFVIGSVGNLYPVKGHLYLVRAIPLVLEKIPNCIFVFAGRGEQEKLLKTEAERLGVCERIMFLGFRSDIPHLLKLFDVFVLPSISECLPLSLLEAMAVGVAPVATKVGGNPEIIEDNINGFLIPPCDPLAIAQKILLVLEKQQFPKKMGANAFRTVCEKFSLGRMLHDYERLYR